MEDSVTQSESLMPHLKINSNGKFEEDKAKGVVNGEKEEEKPSGGGLLTNLISNLVSPSSTPKARDAYEEKAGESDFKRKREDETPNGGVPSEGGGCVFNSLISNFFHGQNEGGEDQEKKRVGNGVVEENKKAKVVEEEGAGGGILNNIGEVVPPPDEASILIHSIIHD